MTALTAEEARARAAVAQWLSRTARDGMATAKAAILEHMGPGDRVHARIDGIDVATVSVTDPKPRETIAVTDPKAFAEWVQEHHPDAIVPTVAEWFCAEGNLKALIAAKGEVPPGVDIIEKTGDPTVQVRINQSQERNLAALAAASPATRYLTQAGERWTTIEEGEQKPRSIINTIKGLEELPIGSVVIGSPGEVWQKKERGCIHPWRSSNGSATSSAALLQRDYSPAGLILLYNPISDDALTNLESLPVGNN